eukprot:6764775-Pyramimonas_sp.AAC.1
MYVRHSSWPCRSVADIGDASRVTSRLDAGRPEDGAPELCGRGAGRGAAPAGRVSETPQRVSPVVVGSRCRMSA